MATVRSVALAAALAFAVLVTVAAIRPASDFRYDDNVNSLGPSFATAERLWREGFPFWNPYSHFGEPALTQLSASPLYPPNVILASVSSLEDLPQRWAILHAALAAAGAAFLARTLGRSPAAAVLAGIVFGLGAPVLYIARTWASFGLAAAWTPWFLGFLLRARRGSLAAVAAGGWALALEGYCGVGEQVIYALLLGSILVLHEKPRTTAGLARAAMTVLVGVLLVSPAALELLSQLSGSNREDRGYVGTVEVAPEAILGAILPAIPSRTQAALAAPRDWGSALYQGFVPALLLLSARWRDLEAREKLLAAVAAGALFFALGDSVGARTLWNFLPVLRTFHYPIGRLPLLGLVLALLAAGALDRVERVALSRLALVALGSAVLAAAGFFAAILADADARHLAAASSSGVLVLGGATVAAAASLLLAPVSWRARLAPGVAAALLFLQLAFFWGGLNSVRPSVRGEVAPVVAAARASGGRVASVFQSRELLALPCPETVSRDLGGTYGFFGAAGYSIVTRRELWLWGYDHVGGAFIPIWTTILSGSALESAGIQFVHGDGGLEYAMARAGRPPRLEPRWKTEHATTYENRAYVGRAYRVARAEAATSELPDLARPDLLDVALVASDSPLLGRAFARGPVTRFEEHPGKIRVELEPVPHESLLVVTSSFATGWRATVDGAPAPVSRVQLLLQGLVVPAGGRTVELSYRSSPLEFGLALAAAGAAASVAFLVAGRRRRPRRAAPSSGDC